MVREDLARVQFAFRKRISDQSYRSAAPAIPRPAVAATVAMASQAAEAHGATASPGTEAQQRRSGMFARRRRGTRGRRE